MKTALYLGSSLTQWNKLGQFAITLPIINLGPIIPVDEGDFNDDDENYSDDIYFKDEQCPQIDLFWTITKLATSVVTYAHYHSTFF